MKQFGDLNKCNKAPVLNVFHLIIATLFPNRQRMRFSTFLIFFTLIASCTFIQKIKDGTTAYDRMQYDVAVDMLKTEYKKEKSRVAKGKLAFMLAESLKKTGQESESIDWYKIAYDNEYGIDALKGYAYALKSTGQYKEAGRAFKDLSIEIGSPYEYRREVQVCKEAESWLEEAKTNGISINPVPINSAYSDYSPVLYGDHELLFTSDRKDSKGETMYNWTGNKFSDLYVADLKSYDVRPFSAPINTDGNEGSSTFNKDQTLMIFTRCFSADKLVDGYCQLYESRKEGDSWSVAKPLNFQEVEVNYMHPSLSPDGATLYFSSDHPDGWGGFDLYYTESNPDGWDDPHLLGRGINTEGNEKFPNVTDDAMYFASDYLPGLGGLDIFKVRKTGPRTWTVAENMKAPINSGKDDFGLTLAPIDQKDTSLLKTGYFSSARSGGLGADDIFVFEMRTPPAPEIIEVPDTVEAAPIVYKMILDGYVLEKIFQDPGNPNSKVLGRKPIANSKVNIVYDDKSENIVTDENGFFTIELEKEMRYNFLASKEGFLNNTNSFSSAGIGEDPENPISKFEIEIELDKIFKNKEITLDNIYYDFDEWFIRDDAKPTLDDLARTLVQNPGISIQLASHTDCRGNSGYNQDLSQRRAQAAVDYLISEGIESNRLSAVGYGENSLAIDCVCNRCTEEEHQVNRRTTFKVLD